MGSRLVNVRLDDQRIRKVEALRGRGVSLSVVVRDAIDERYAALRPTRSARDIAALIEQIFEEYPDPPQRPSRRYDVHDRRAARAAIRRRLRRVSR